MKHPRRIAMIYREIGTCGGIQRGASFQINQFEKWGYEPIVLTEHDLGAVDERQARLVEILRARQADVVIEHDTYNKTKLRTDIAAAHEVGIPIVVFWHSIFSCLIASGFRKAADVYPLLKNADAMIALSPTDEAFFRLLGLRTLAIPYCDADLMAGFKRKSHPHRVIWMGRFVPEKRVNDAVLILKRLRERVADAELVVLGGGALNEEMEFLSFVRGAGLPKNAITFAGYQKDVRPYLESAGAGLVTSEFEGFCHAIVEMKMASLPIVAYSMPYLETLGDGTGSVQVPQRDVDAAAARLAELFTDEEMCARQGALSRSSYERLRAFDERAAYDRLFADLAVPLSESSLTKPDPSWFPAIFDIIVRHGVTGLDSFERRLRRKFFGREGAWGLRGTVMRIMMKLRRHLGWFPARKNVLQESSCPIHRPTPCKQCSRCGKERTARFETSYLPPYRSDGDVGSSRECPKVSVIIPVYNVENYLSECLDSILGQTLGEIEVLCVDDGSTDASPGILADYAARDHRIKLFHIPHSGPYVARREGLINAKGEYVYYMDSDDIISQNAFYELVRLADEEALDEVVFGAEIQISGKVPNGDRMRSRFEKIYTLPPSLCGKVMSGQELFRALCAAGCYSPGPPLRIVRRGVLVRKESAFPNAHFHGDNYFTTVSLYNSKRACAVARKYYLRRMRADSITTSIGTEKTHFISILNVIIALCSFQPFMKDAVAGDPAATWYLRRLHASLARWAERIDAGELSELCLQSDDGGRVGAFFVSASRPIAIDRRKRPNSIRGCVRFILRRIFHGPCSPC